MTAEDGASSNGESGRSSARLALRLAALLVASALAIFVSAPDALHAPKPMPGVPWLEREMLPLRPRIPEHARVALLVRDDDPALWYATQYALAPAIVLRVPVARCMLADGRECAPGATHLLAQVSESAVAVQIGADAGFSYVASSPGFVLLARGAR